MIYGKEAMPLLERYKAAAEVEAAAISALHDALQRGVKDRDILDTLTQRMTDAHAASMDLLAELQQFRLD